MLPSNQEHARSAFESSATFAGQNMPSTIYPNGHFSNISPLLNDSAWGSAVQATASLQYYNFPCNHLTPAAMLSPDSFVNLGNAVAPELPLRREHAESPAIQQQLLKIRDNRIHRENQSFSTDPSDLASHQLLSATKAVSPRGSSSTPHMIKPTISKEVKVAGGHVPGLHCDTPKVSIQANGQRSQSGHDTAMPQNFLPERTKANPEFSVHHAKEPTNVRQLCPRQKTEPENVATTAFPINSQSHRNLDVFPSPMYNTYASSTSISPEGNFSWSPGQTFGTPASSEPYNTSNINTPNSLFGDQTRVFPTADTSQHGTPSPSAKPRKRKLSHGEGLQKESTSSTIIPIDVKSASRSEGQRRKHEREASARYRQKKKVKKSAEAPEEANKSGAINTISSNAKEYDSHGSANLAPPTGTEMNLSSSQQSFLSNLSCSSHISIPSGSINMATAPQRTETPGEGWPDLPELHPYERRRKINYGLLVPYGSAETIQDYPPSFQASLHRVMDFQKTEYLKANSHRVLFVYGSLMMSDLWHDVFEKTTEWIFHNEIVKKCMCPAKVPGYSRFSVRGSDEPVMIKAEKSASVSTHGMLIFGLTAENFRVLDRYLADGFVLEDVSAYVNLKSSSTNFQVSSYVWPRGSSSSSGRGSKTVRVDHDVEWTVARFWNESRLCRIWREAVMERKRLLAEASAEEEAAGWHAVAMAHSIHNS